MDESPVPSPLQQDAEGQVVEKTLDELRDEKCIPIARQMFTHIASDMLPENANEKVDFNPVILSLLQISVDNDMNLIMENPYAFQLMLTALSGLNLAVQSAVTTPIDDVRYARIGRQILQFVSDANVTLDKVTKEQQVEEFAPIKVKIDALFAEENLNMMEVKYIMDNIFTSFTQVQNGFTGSTEQSTKIAEEKMWGVSDMSEVTMGMVDAKLKS